MSNHGRDEYPDDCDKSDKLDEILDELDDALTDDCEKRSKPKEWWEEEDEKDVKEYFENLNKITIDNFHELDIPFIKKAIEIGKLVGVKNRAYGNAFYDSGKILKILYPKGVSLEQMDDMLAVVRILDKIFRIASEKKALGESPYRDIAGYGILGYTREDSEVPEE